MLTACGTLATPTPTITPVPTDPPTDEFCPPPQNWISYITQPGDSIASLARRTSTTVQALELANCLNNPRGALLARQVFYLPRQPLPP
ncbi:MAG TPA: LysM peptidoglycan-binding domain-containing protein [Phototrophicaceae bacterium]|nr:LysM peptidoglycan-binding domain-containing protein [Phototrophicaceae bacterium]